MVCCDANDFFAGISVSMNSLNLIKWKDEHGDRQTYHLVKKVSSKWIEFGLALGLENNELEAWEADLRGQTERCWRKVMQHWLDGGTNDYPSTWEGLYEMLTDQGYAEVAKGLKTAVENSFR